MGVFYLSIILLVSYSGLKLFLDRHSLILLEKDVPFILNESLFLSDDTLLSASSCPRLFLLLIPIFLNPSFCSNFNTRKLTLSLYSAIV